MQTDTDTVAYSLSNSRRLIEEASSEATAETRMDAWCTVVEDMAFALARRDHNFDRERFLIGATYPLEG